MISSVKHACHGVKGVLRFDGVSVVNYGGVALK